VVSEVVVPPEDPPPIDGDSASLSLFTTVEAAGQFSPSRGHNTNAIIIATVYTL